MSERSAVVRISGSQYRVHEHDVVKVPLLTEEVGAKIELSDVLLVSGEDTRIGTPTVEGASVKAEVLEHGRDKKIIVFKKKRRQDYRKKAGHRQYFTSLKITSIEG
jgi:large subunit ribosomal protein L21